MKYKRYPSGGISQTYIAGRYNIKLAKKAYSDVQLPMAVHALYTRFNYSDLKQTSRTEVGRGDRVLKQELISRFNLLKKGLRGQRWMSRHCHEEAKYLFEFSDHMILHIESIFQDI